jgi:hypothetical protein
LVTKLLPAGKGRRSAERRGFIASRSTVSLAPRSFTSSFLAGANAS